MEGQTQGSMGQAQVQTGLGRTRLDFLTSRCQNCSTWKPTYKEQRGNEDCLFKFAASLDLKSFGPCFRLTVHGYLPDSSYQHSYHLQPADFL